MELIFLTVDDVIFIQSEILSSAPITDIGKLSPLLNAQNNIIIQKRLQRND